MTSGIRCSPCRLQGTALIAIGMLFLALHQADAQVEVPLPSVQLDGSRSEILGRYHLADSFRFSAQLRVDASDQWRHVVELGGVEHGMNAPLRLEMGNPGEWYVAMGDGQGYEEITAQGQWTLGDWVEVVFEFDNGTGRLYENGQLLAELTSSRDVTRPEGTLILGSHKGTERFVQGEIKPQPLRMGLVPIVNYGIPGGTFDGATSQVEGGFVLPPTFTVTAEVRVTHSDQWRHLLEIGGKEHGWSASFRLETGNAGEWYVAVSDGQQTVDATGMGSWDSGEWVTVVVTYDQGKGRLFENDRLLAEFDGPADLGATGGSLVVGSHKGDSRFFEGELRHARLRSGVTYTPSDPATTAPAMIFQYPEGANGRDSQFSLERRNRIGTVSMAGLQSYTVSFWCQQVGGGGVDVRTLLEVVNNDGSGPYFGSGAGRRLQFRQSTPENANEGAELERNFFRKYTHVAATWTQADGQAEMQLYFDGKPQLAAGTTTDDAVFPDAILEVWTGNDSPWDRTNAMLADIRIYNYVLSAAELAALPR